MGFLQPTSRDLPSDVNFFHAANSHRKRWKRRDFSGKTHGSSAHFVIATIFFPMGLRLRAAPGPRVFEVLVWQFGI